MNRRFYALSLLAGSLALGGLAAVLFVLLQFRPDLLQQLAMRLRHPSMEAFSPELPEHVGGHLAEEGGMRIHLLRQVAGQPAQSGDTVLDFDADCRLGLAVEHEGLVYAHFESLRLGAEPVPRERLRPFAELPGLREVVWLKVEPQKRHYANRNSIPGWWGSIAYRESVWRISSEAQQADVAGQWLRGVNWQGRAVGTMRYKAAVRFADHYLSTPGAESVQRGGRLPGVLRLSRRGDTGNAVVDEALALANLPYIWGSAAFQGVGSPHSHQAERYIGADCADLVMAAWRKARVTSQRYSGAVPLTMQLRHRAGAFAVAGKKDGVYLDAAGNEIPFGPKGVLAGAGIFWNYGKGRGHAGLLVQDSGPLGVANGLLDVHDHVYHTSWNTPVIEDLGRIARGRLPALAVNAASVG